MLAHRELASKSSTIGYKTPDQRWNNGVVGAESHWGSGKFALRAARVAPRVPPVPLVGRSVSLVTPPLLAYPMAEPDGPPSPTWSHMLPTPPPHHRRFTNQANGQPPGDPPLIEIPSSGALGESTGSNRSNDQSGVKTTGMYCGIDWVSDHHEVASVWAAGNREKV
jgi:hypothetical protein